MKRRLIRFLSAVAVGVLAGAGAAILLKGYLSPKALPPGRPAATVESDAGAEASVSDSPAWRYVHALQQGNWDAAIEQTLWMQDRLAQVRRSTGSEEAVAEARRELRRRLSDYTVAENILRPEGVEDQYIFTSRVRVSLLREDSGSEELEAPVARRSWFRVEYLDRASALRDDQGLPIRAMAVGLNVSERGEVLKAGIIGNLEIDFASVSYGWALAQGG